MAIIAVATPQTSPETGLPEHFAWAVAIAVTSSFVLAAIEIAKESGKPLRSCLVPQSFFYCFLLTFGNVVTTIMATPLLTKLAPNLKAFHFFFSPFIGVFAFEIILKNMNVTAFDKGVLTIQTWMNKALSLAAEEAIVKDIQRTDRERGKLAGMLRAIPEVELNTFVALKLSATSPNIVQQLDAKANANNADSRLYKAYAVVTVVSASEVDSFLKSL